MVKQEVRRFTIRLLNTADSFACRSDESVLYAMELLGYRGIPVGCRGGGCGVCRVRVRSGQYTVRKMSRACVSEAEEAVGVVLACKLIPHSDLDLEVLGKMLKCLSAARSAPETPHAARMKAPR
ncbi:2Fe-2S iron-sulfur cluster-binding protein [Denitromonas halophila]|uniref:2Fe-2S iron-sulfur cluster binding domain-containing protein n=1 Tax=Denitromonas halophila TaxID=1629404 RepID=A0A557QWE0_9RHOO|nr:2Fe-2S iron-sulfur cluster-binding protein [Denitromonas halophila]TVO57231.1 2Fe-2S iron-sulfur cluster binding domain-containing protein [Denitromonas halophila]